MITVKTQHFVMTCQGITPQAARNILKLAEGMTQRQIAAEEGVTHQCIEIRLRAAKQAFNVKTPIQLVARCMTMGLIKERKEHG
ncbi:helix-turn-helix transcriptional regulator [Endozoicomonas atrinae]|jgi:DNA-binding NarL/FixJ family response regulator|uniref:helix-turn-helix transcriptional regulator n=1 Tax=Endozoicomonas atrinae TaxID=1333660 RepID=UPI000824A8AB|nr:hypothetical protein [Endozoicomonas atrinae]